MEVAFSGAWHSFPQEPQFWMLVARLSQTPPQDFCPGGQPHMLLALSRQASPLDTAQQVSPQAVLPSGQGAQEQVAWLQWEFPVQTQLCVPSLKRHRGSEQLMGPLRCFSLSCHLLHRFGRALPHFIFT